MNKDDLMGHFADPAAVARYAEGPPRFVPGFADLHRMATVLIAELAPPDAQVLVLGAGGGLELRAFADAQPGWRFDGIDPSAQMLDLARQNLGPHAGRARLHEGYIESAPGGPFDAAACLLTLHFLPPDERLRTLEEIRRRLVQGAPFVAAHASVPPGPAREAWLRRYAEFAILGGADPSLAETARAAIAAHLHILGPEGDEAILREAGFSDVTPFYAAFTWRGWVAYA